MDKVMFSQNIIYNKLIKSFSIGCITTNQLFLGKNPQYFEQSHHDLLI